MEEEEGLAFCSSKMQGGSSSNPEVCNSASAKFAMNGSTSAPDDLGYMRRSFDSSDHALNMDGSLRSGDASDESSDEHIGDVNNEGEFLKMLSASDNFMNNDDLSSSDSSSSSSSEDMDVSQRSGLDCVYRMGKAIEEVEPVNFGSQDKLNSSNQDDQIDTPKEDEDANLNGEQTAATKTTVNPSPNSEDPPLSMNTNNPLDVSNHTIPLTNKLTERSRTLSTISLISLLKIQNIPEHGTFKDDIEIDEVKLEETSRPGDDEESVISELGDSQREGDNDASLPEVRNENYDSLDQADEDVVRIDIMPMKDNLKPPENALGVSELAGECKDKVSPNNKSQGSFIPLPELPTHEQQVIHNLPGSRRNPSLKSQGNSPTEGEDSSTYFLQSLKSAGQVTHMSDGE